MLRDFIAHIVCISDVIEDAADDLDIIIVKQTGSFTMSFDTAYKFESGSAPTITTGAGAVDILTFVSDGTSLYGAAAQNFS